MSRAHRRAGVRRADDTAGRFIPAKPLLRSSAAQASAKSPCPGPARRCAAARWAAVRAAFRGSLGRGAANKRRPGCALSQPSPSSARAPHKRQPNRLARGRPGDARRPSRAAVRAASCGSLGRGAASRRQRGALYPRQAPPPLKRRTSLSQIAVPGAGPAMRGGWAAVRAASCGSLAFIGQVRLGRTKAARSCALSRIAGR